MDEHFILRTTYTSHPLKHNLETTLKKTRRKQILTILKAHHRTNRSFKVITELMSLIKQEPLFQPFVNNFRVISEVCQKLETCTFHKGERIYQIKDRGDYFYILLQGTVHLTIPGQKFSKELKESQAKQESIQPSQSDLFSAFLDMQTTDNKTAANQPQLPQISEMEAVQRIIDIIQEGQSFGEMMQDSVLRLSNAYAVERCELLCLDKKSYQTLLKAQLKSQNHNKYIFLEQIPLFKTVSSFALSRIAIMMKQQKLLYGQTLFRCGGLIKDIYIVRSGSFKLLRRIKRHSRMTVASKLEELKIDSQDKKSAEYLIINEGEVLGDSQTLQMKTNYQQSCICQSQEANVLAIDKKQLFKLFLEDPQGFDKIKVLISTKNLWKSKIVNSFVERRTSNTLMNSYLTNPKRSITEASKDSKQSSLRQQIENQTFFYNQFNKTIVSTTNKCRFSISKGKCHTENKPENLFAPRNKKKQGVPHGIEDIVQLVKLKAEFQKRFRRERRQKYLFKFNKDEVPLYIKSKFDRFQ